MYTSWRNKKESLGISRRVGRLNQFLIWLLLPINSHPHITSSSKFKSNLSFPISLSYFLLYSKKKNPSFLPSFSCFFFPIFAHSYTHGTFIYVYFFYWSSPLKHLFADNLLYFFNDFFNFFVQETEMSNVKYEEVNLFKKAQMV